MTNRIKICLTGLNTTSKKISFSHVKVTVPAVKDLGFKALFTEEDLRKWIRMEDLNRLPSQRSLSMKSLEQKTPSWKTPRLQGLD